MKIDYEINFKNGSTIKSIHSDEIIQGNRSKIILVPDRKEYYKGLSKIKWYYYQFVNYIKNL